MLSFPTCTLKIKINLNYMGRHRRKKRNPRGLTRHHILNRKNGGKSEPENLLTLSEYKHNLLHFIFKNFDLYEMILILIRTARIKKYDKINPKIRNLYKFI